MRPLLHPLNDRERWRLRRRTRRVALVGTFLFYLAANLTYHIFGPKPKTHDMGTWPGVAELTDTKPTMNPLANRVSADTAAAKVSVRIDALHRRHVDLDVNVGYRLNKRPLVFGGALAFTSGKWSLTGSGEHTADATSGLAVLRRQITPVVSSSLFAELHQGPGLQVEATLPRQKVTTSTKVYFPTEDRSVRLAVDVNKKF